MCIFLRTYSICFCSFESKSSSGFTGSEFSSTVGTDILEDECWTHGTEWYICFSQWRKRSSSNFCNFLMFMVQDPRLWWSLSAFLSDAILVTFSNTWDGVASICVGTSGGCAGKSGFARFVNFSPDLFWFWLVFWKLARSARTPPRSARFVAPAFPGDATYFVVGAELLFLVQVTFPSVHIAFLVVHQTFLGCNWLLILTNRGCNRLCLWCSWLFCLCTKLSLGAIGFWFLHIAGAAFFFFGAVGFRNWKIMTASRQ